jgi:hypothetical protein
MVWIEIGSTFNDLYPVTTWSINVTFDSWEELVNFPNLLYNAVINSYTKSTMTEKVQIIYNFLYLGYVLHGVELIQTANQILETTSNLKSFIDPELTVVHREMQAHQDTGKYYLYAQGAIPTFFSFRTFFK